MLELLDELRRAEFDVFIVTGGGTEFVRAIGTEFYGVAPDRVLGTQASYDFVRDADGRGGLIRNADLVAADANEGAAKVVNIQRALGRRPIFAAGNSPGDGEMLDSTMAADGPTLALLVDHDDADRGYAYESVAATFETMGSFLDTAIAHGWTVASMRTDSATVFATDPAERCFRADRSHGNSSLRMGALATALALVGGLLLATPVAAQGERSPRGTGTGREVRPDHDAQGAGRAVRSRRRAVRPDRGRHRADNPDVVLRQVGRGDPVLMQAPGPE